ncbi:CD209 antigen-like protein E isoform X14 [Dicentrarchus labrax]|uniref:CD209 antigen-like protein E isoform X14 n=1 Tax=Dicentrarchus labrax TaxID=13489 RepID=UPI0021F593D1|nr:CD209 antigen-like protein E isoform X14 [Dicentrarchus labrax]
MSVDILAAPDLSLNVRCTRKVQENRGEGEENQMEITEDEEYHVDLGPQTARAQTQKNRAAVKRRCFKVTTVTLGVMYLLILAGTYIRYILVTLEKTQLQTRNDQLSKNYSQLQGTLSGIKVNNSQLQDEVKQLKAKIEGKCPEGWRKFGYSCYFKSNEWKTWYDSRSYCQNKGADLVIINYEEEQKFVKELNLYGESWIGLQGTNGKWTGSGRTGKWVWEWKWVDSSPLTQMFWASGMPYGSQNQYTAACCDTQGKWKVSSSYDTKNWICEK